ncbi:hypothetical protein BZG36_00314 [Bifiguratus adelaidae]|uniref:Rieske domain-containing protein n=1 Tax=Bifiguratus adelaidae TaxID=1938954 RepID=A0A261Y7R0_9FUNG|nr:hypothetical protein BZG36_00314 [Bifiguratus adelaidae]
MAGMATTTGVQEPEEVAFPESTRVSTLLEQIAKERSWSDEQILQDLTIADKHRLYFVKDLLLLSDQSWQVIELLPLVKDLLRQSISIGRQKEDAKALKRAKKAEYKKQQRMDMEAALRSNNNDTSNAGDLEKLENTSAAEPSVQSLVPLVQYTRLTPQPTGSSQTLTLTPKPTSQSLDDTESQSFSQKAERRGSGSSIPSSSSSSSSDFSASTPPSNANGSKANSGLTGSTTTRVRRIMPKGPNRILVTAASGKTFEADRYCPHKKVDLATWGAVVGDNLICTKHNWSFRLDGGGYCAKEGKSIHASPCKVNDW